MRGSRNKFQGGGGGDSGLAAKKQSGQRFFSPQLILQFTEGIQSMDVLQRKLYFSKDPEGVQHFLGGGGCPNANFYRNPYHL